MTIAARFLPAIPLAALLLAGAAQAESRASAVVSAQAGYGSDPFYGSSGNQDSSGSVVVSAAPTMTFLGPTSNVSLTGNIEHTFFSRQYSDLTNWTLGGNAGVQLGPNSSFALAAVYASTINSGLATSINTSLPTPDVHDPPAGSLRRRTCRPAKPDIVEQRQLQHGSCSAHVAQPQRQCLEGGLSLCLRLQLCELRRLRFRDACLQFETQCGAGPQFFEDGL